MSATSKAAIARRRRLKGIMAKWVQAHRHSRAALKHPRTARRYNIRFLRELHKAGAPRWDF